MGLFDNEKDIPALNSAHQKLMVDGDPIAMVELADQGSLAGMVYLAHYYDEIVKEWGNAKLWYYKSIENGYAPSAYTLGRGLQQRGLIDEAAHVFSLGWKMGDLPSGYRLAIIKRRNGNDKDYRNLIMAVSERGNIWALRNSIRICLQEGKYTSALVRIFRLLGGILVLIYKPIIGKQAPYERYYG